ncbi:MAG: peptidoglycan DD-metalloendopeptidase family protein [Lachnospiraceae bacterium]
MPLESGGCQKILSGEAPHLQDDGLRNPVQTDSTDMHPDRAGGQNPDLNLGAGREDINLGQNGQPQEQAYNSEERRDVYQNREESFDEQRQNYTEKAFNSYDYETFIEQVTVTNEFRRAASAHTGDRLTSPPAIPSANPDSELELSEWAQEMMDRNGKHISLLKQDKVENNRQRERLKKKQPSVKKYSIKEGRKVEKKLNEREYGRQRSKENRESERREQRIAAAKRTGRLLFNDENIEEDEDSAAIKHAVHKGAYIAKRNIRKNIRDISDKSYVYKRLRFKDKKDRLVDREGQRLKHEQGRILAVNRKMSELDKMSATSAVIKTAPETGRQETMDKKETAHRAENRKIQQQKKQRERIARQQERIRNESVRRNHRYQHRMNKTSRKERRIQRKRNMTVISSMASIVVVLMIVLMMIVLFLMSFFQMVAQITSKTVTQNDYTVLTDVTEYLRNQEAELRNIMEGEGKEELEKDLDEECFAQTGKHIYEFIYDLPEFGFDDITLMAYLSAKFFEFDLQLVQDELDEIFELMYQINIRFEEEERTFYDEYGNPYTQEVMICYITVSKTELEEIVEARLDDEALELYNSYKLSSGGQQAYGPALDGIDWSGKISSGFGERIHPITGKKTFHDGVDIAIPTGTRLYSAVTGQVVKAYYSDSGGNMVTVRTESGWEVTYMHMDSLAVSAGQTVFKGQFVGCSGNTGNSTGPHLHIRVHDADDRKINPVFIIPQSGHVYSNDQY